MSSEPFTSQKKLMFAINAGLLGNEVNDIFSLKIALNEAAGPIIRQFLVDHGLEIFTQPDALDRLIKLQGND